MQSLFCKSSSHTKLEEMAQLIETLDQAGGGVTGLDKKLVCIYLGMQKVGHMHNILGSAIFLTLGPYIY